MIVVRVELWSARDGSRRELARMRIANTGEGAERLRHYDGETLTGRSSAALDRGEVNRRGAVRDYPAEVIHIWCLVGRMLSAMGYR